MPYSMRCATFARRSNNSRLTSPLRALKRVQRPPSSPVILSQGVGEWGDAAKDGGSSGRCDQNSNYLVLRPEALFCPPLGCRRRDSNPHAVSRNGF